MELEEFEAIFGEPRVEWRGSSSSSASASASDRFVFQVHAVDSSHIAVQVTDFRSNSWEARRSLVQLEDMRDDVGIGGSWSEFLEYISASFRSRDVKLVLDGQTTSDMLTGSENAKLVAQKAKGMPVILISLARLTGSHASEAIAKLSLQLFEAFKRVSDSYVKEKDRSVQLKNVISTEKEKSESLKRQLEQYTKRQKLQRTASSDIAGGPSLSTNGLQSPEKEGARDTGSTKVAVRAVPAYRRARVRGARLQDIDDIDDNDKQ